MREIIALARKDLKLLLRDKAGFFFTFFFPLLMAVFFGTMFSGGGDDDGSAISILVIDEDNTPKSQEFIEKLQKSEELKVTVMAKADAIERVRRGRSVAYVVLTSGFGEAQERMFWGDPPTVELGVDPARRAEAGLLQGVLIKYAAENMQEMFSNPSGMRNQIGQALDNLKTADLPVSGQENLVSFLTELDRFMADTVQTTTNDNMQRGFEPLKIDKAEIVRQRSGPNNAYAISFPQGIVWGMIGCAAAFGISLVVERTRGTLLRLRIAPISQIQILGGKALACFVTTLGISVAMLLIARLVFGVQPTSLPNLGIAVLSISVAFVGIMMFLSVLGKTEQAAGGIGWAVLLMMSMLGGGMIPLFIMPTWMQTVSHVSPVKWSILALEGAIWRNFNIIEMLVPCGILVAVGAVFFSIGIRVFRWSVAE